MATSPRRRIASLFALLALGLAGASARGGVAEPPVLSPNLTSFPASSLIDASDLLDAPAGKRGFVTTGGDGRFTFQDGARARFFGVNIAKTSVIQPKETIDQVVATLAGAGINLVRLHHIDDAPGIIDLTTDDSRHFDATNLDLLDYWIYRCKQRGIYVYLDLLDYRTFRAGDGVENAAALGRAAKPVAVFDRRLIALQKEYATRLLRDHINPYTGLSYAADPAVALIEIFDENGLLIRGADWARLRSPYDQELTARWNDWLIERYGTTARLAAVWTDTRGRSALQAGESLENGTVQLPDMGLPAKPETDYRSALTAAARRNDGARFAHDVQTAFFREMKAHLRGIGVRVPITAVVSGDQLPDLDSVATTLDFIGVNYYWDHPAFLASSPWRLPAFFDCRNPFTGDGANSFAPAISVARIAGKPLVVREWGYCYPNPYRAAGMIEAAAYGALLDVDALILFTYDDHPDARGVGYFDAHADPARWGLTATAARLFLEQRVRPAQQTTAITYSAADLFTYYRYRSPLYREAWLHRVVNQLPESPTTNADRVLPSGHNGRPARAVAAPTRARSDTGEVIRDPAAGLLKVNTPTLHALAGNLSNPAATSTADLKVRSASPIATVIVLSLDGRPVTSSSSLLIKMVTGARNTGEQLALARGKAPKAYRLSALGGLPVVTGGQASAKPTDIFIGTRLLVRAYLTGGTFEVTLTPESAVVYCDTPDVRFGLPGLGAARAVAIYPDGRRSDIGGAQSFVYPRGARLVLVGAAADTSRLGAQEAPFRAGTAGRVGEHLDR